jgi:putative SOS response-associated peptidase YedK
MPPTSATNARIETAVSKPMWRSAIRYSRALVPARGYYEWTQTSQLKQTYFMRLLDDPLTCFAGMWSSWRDMASFTILVGPAASHLAHIHDRMPLKLPRSAWGPWLDPEQRDGAVALAPAQAAALSHFEPLRVSTWVNRSKNEGPRCIEPIGDGQEICAGCDRLHGRDGRVVRSSHRINAAHRDRLGAVRWPITPSRPNAGTCKGCK